MINNQENKYQSMNYNSLSRFASYHEQLKLFFEYYKKGNSVLEIGIGSKVFYNFLKETGVNIKTLDINKDLNPDIVSNICKTELKSNSFDFVCAFEILEHLPYKNSLKSLGEIHRITKKYVLMSIPYSCIYFGLTFYLGLPLIDKLLSFGIRLPHFLLNPHYGSKEHFWELGKRGYSKIKFKKDLEKVGFKILISKHIPLNRKHYFIVARKI